MRNPEFGFKVPSYKAKHTATNSKIKYSDTCIRCKTAKTFHDPRSGIWWSCCTNCLQEINCGPFRIRYSTYES